MKLKFDPNQQYQLDAINAVVDIFAGQPKDSDGATRHIDQDGQLSLEATIARGIVWCWTLRRLLKICARCSSGMIPCRLW